MSKCLEPSCFGASTSASARGRSKDLSNRDLLHIQLEKEETSEHKRWRCNFATFSSSSSVKNLNIHTASDKTVDGSLQLSDGSHHACKGFQP